MKNTHELEASACKLCNGTYKNKRALGRHMRYAHNGKDNNQFPIKNVATEDNISSPNQPTVSSNTTLPIKNTTPPSYTTSHSNTTASPPPPLPVPTVPSPYSLPQHPTVVSPTNCSPDQYNTYSMDMSTIQMETLRRQLQYSQRMTLENQDRQWQQHQ